MEDLRKLLRANSIVSNQNVVYPFLRTVEADPVLFKGANLKNLRIGPRSPSVWLQYHRRYRGLSFANADLSGSRFQKVQFFNCVFSGANLSGVTFKECYFSGCWFADSNLTGATFPDSSFDYMDYRYFEGATLPDHVHPEAGKEIIAYKKIIAPFPGRDYGDYHGGQCRTAIAVLRIPAEAKRVRNISGEKKCRAEYAEVLDIHQVRNEEKKYLYGFSVRSKEFRYEPGQIVRPVMAFDPNFLKTCGSGIHFYLKLSQAKRH